MSDLHARTLSKIVLANPIRAAMVTTGYVIFEGYIEFESEAHFQRLSNAHSVFDKTMKETGWTHGYKFSKPHEHDEVLRCESTGQQRKLVRKIY